MQSNSSDRNSMPVIATALQFDCAGPLSGADPPHAQTPRGANTERNALPLTMLGALWPGSAHRLQEQSLADKR